MAPSLLIKHDMKKMKELEEKASADIIEIGYKCKRLVKYKFNLIDDCVKLKDHEFSVQHVFILN